MVDGRSQLFVALGKGGNHGEGVFYIDPPILVCKRDGFGKQVKLVPVGVLDGKSTYIHNHVLRA